MGRATAGAISRPSASSSVVVDDVATLVDLEHGLGFAIYDHVHGMREWRRKVYIDAQSVSRCAGYPSASGGSSRRRTRPALGRTRRTCSRCRNRRASTRCLRPARGLYSVRRGLYSVRRSTQTQLRKRVYADTRVMGFILLCRSPRVFTQTYAIAVCVPFQGDGFILYDA